jgi:hypothetical protein
MTTFAENIAASVHTKIAEIAVAAARAAVAQR